MNLLLSFGPLRQLEEDLESVGPEDLENGAPNTPIGFADNVVGTAGVSLRHLFVVFQGKAKGTARAAKQHELDVHLADIPDMEKLKACERAHREIEQQLTYAQLLKEIFRASLRAEFPELNGHTLIDVRRGWQVVWIDEEKLLRETLSPLMQGLFGKSMPTGNPFAFFPFFPSLDRLMEQRMEEEDDDPDGPVGQAC